MLGRILVVAGLSLSAEANKKEFSSIEAAIRFAEEFTGCPVEVSARFRPLRTLDVLSRLLQV